MSGLSSPGPFFPLPAGVLRSWISVAATCRFSLRCRQTSVFSSSEPRSNPSFENPELLGDFGSAELPLSREFRELFWSLISSPEESRCDRREFVNSIVSGAFRGNSSRISAIPRGAWGFDFSKGLSYISSNSSSLPVDGLPNCEGFKLLSITISERSSDMFSNYLSFTVYTPIPI